jgi:tetratricopeptide (TPR) repeat protein
MARLQSVIALVLAAAALAGCPSETTTPQQPVGPRPGYPNVMVPPRPGSGGVQYGVPDPAPAGAAAMNAEAQNFYRQGMEAWAAGNLQAAQGFFTQATQADSQAYQAYYSLGAVQERLKTYSAALSSYERAFTIIPDYERAMVAYGMLLASKQNKLSEADEFFTRKRQKLPKSAALIAAQAEVKSLNRDTAGAQQLAQEALKINPSYAPAMMTIARDHYRNRRLDLSLYALKAVLDGFGPDNPPRDKDNAEAHLLRAFIWAETDQRPLAMEAFRRAVELRPDIVVARLMLATYLLESGGADEALPMLQQALAFDSDNVAAHLRLGDAYRLTGQFPQALKEFEWVKARDASMAEVHYNMGLLYLLAPSVPGMNAKQQVDAAIASFNKFKDLRPKGEASDVDELLKRATTKKEEIEALEAAKRPQPAAPPPGTGGAKTAPPPASGASTAQPAPKTQPPPKTK